MVSCADKCLLVQPLMYARYKAAGYPPQVGLKRCWYHIAYLLFVSPILQFNYRSKAIMLWQRLGGVDVFIYGVYMQASVSTKVF
jgi:hypothetical protein